MEEYLYNLIAYLRKNQKGLRDDNELRYFIMNDEVNLELKYTYKPKQKDEEDLPF